jgi:hypothetical protein
LIERKFAPFAERPERACGGRRGGRPCVSGRGRARARTRRGPRNTRARACARVRARPSRGRDARARETRARRGMREKTGHAVVFRAKRVKIGPRERRRGSTAARARETWRAIRAERVPCGRFGWSASRSTRVSAPRARETGDVMLFPRFRVPNLNEKKVPFATCNQSEKRRFF